jgi:ubiquinone/menaquinone biosynthesis C-methylase UbiE
MPMHALDLGCGSGHWLLEAANAWRTSLVTGFDLVDTLIPEVRGQDTIRFVRGNLCVSSCSTCPSSNIATVS